jgi:hypothetical protein
MAFTTLFKIISFLLFITWLNTKDQPDIFNLQNLKTRITAFHKMLIFQKKRAPEIKPSINSTGRQNNFSGTVRSYCDNKVEELFDSKSKNVYFEDTKLFDWREDFNLPEPPEVTTNKPLHIPRFYCTKPCGITELPQVQGVKDEEFIAKKRALGTFLTPKKRIQLLFIA